LKSVVKETKAELLSTHRLDPAFLSTPAIALGQAAREILYMADITMKMLEDAIVVFRNRDSTLRKKIIDTDDKVDALEETITPYLTKISEEELDAELSHFHKALLNAVNEIEHVGDIISKNLMTYAKRQIDTGFVFSKEGFEQIEKLHQFALATLRIATDALTTHDEKLAREASTRKEIGHNMAKEYNELHLDRLRRGLKESLETSTIHVDLMSDLERINFHAAVIGEALL
jgi:phosphate:Na+ symporter